MSAELLLHLELDKSDVVGGQVVVKDAAGHGDGELHGRVDIVEDENFGACAVFDGDVGDRIRVRPGPALDIKGDFTVQAWVCVSDPSLASAAMVRFGQLPGSRYALSLLGDRWVFQCPDLIDGLIAVRPTEPGAGNWHHLAGVMCGNKASFHVHDLRGKRIGHVEVNYGGPIPAAPAGGLAVGFMTAARTAGPVGKMAHVRLYRGARTAEEIQKDIAGDRLALAHFRKSHPIDFRLYDDDDQAVLYITDDPDGSDLNVELRNTSTQAIRLDADGHGGAASEAHHHFALRFNPGILSMATLARLADPRRSANLVESDESWELYFPPRLPEAAEIVSLYLLYKGDKPIFQPNQRRMLKLRNMSAAPGSGARGTLVQLHPRNLTTADDDATAVTGMRTQYLHVANHRGQKNIPLHVWFAAGDTLLADGKPHNLTLRIANGSNRADIALTAKSDAAASRFLISFDIGDNASNWALTDKASADKVEMLMKQGHGELAEPSRGQGTGREWELRFAAAQVLHRQGSREHNHLDITIQGLAVPPGWYGRANLYVRYENIPGYQDGQFIVTVQKSVLDVGSHAVGIGRPASSEYTLTVNGSAHVGGDGGGHSGHKNLLRVDGEISGNALRLALGPQVWGVRAATAPSVVVGEVIPTVSYVNELTGSMQDALFFSAVKVLSQNDAALELDFDPVMRPRVVIAGNDVRYQGFLKLTTRHPLWAMPDRKWDTVIEAMQMAQNTFNLNPRLELAIATTAAQGRLTLRSQKQATAGIEVAWQIFGGKLTLRLEEAVHRSIYGYSGHHNGVRDATFEDHFKESVHWIDLAQISYKL